jgi:hypothetical protein
MKIKKILVEIIGVFFYWYCDGLFIRCKSK